MRERLWRLGAWYVWIWARVVLASRRPRIIAITGTVGKTTTKEILTLALRTPEARPFVGEVGSTIQNWNNDLGIPLSILGGATVAETKFREGLLAPVRAIAFLFGRRYPDTLVLEVAAGPRGRVGNNARRLAPQVAVVTAIGPGHLSTFGTVEGVARAKAGLLEAVRPNGLVVMGGDDNPWLEVMRARTEVRTEVVEGRGTDLAVAVTHRVCAYLGVPETAVRAAMVRFEGLSGRGQEVQLGGVHLINDAYNANPLSMRYALDRLSGRTEQRKVAILGWMGELGPDSSEFHAEVAPLAAGAADVVVAIGELGRQYAPDLWFATSEACAAEISKLVRPGDAVLVKGSNVARMNRVVFALKDRFGPVDVRGSVQDA